MKQFLLISAVSLGAFLTPAFAASVDLTPSDPNPAISSFFDVFVDLNGAFSTPHDAAGNSFSGFGFDVAVGDPSILNFTGYTLGSDFDENDFSGFFGADVSAGSNDPGGVTASSFNLAVLHFSVLGIGTSSISVAAAYDPANDLGLVYTDINDPGQAIDSSIDVTTAATVAPEPSTWILGASALAGLGLLRTRRRHSL